jgi:hypothetical protein
MKKTQTTNEAIQAIQDAGHKSHGTDEAVKFFDPRKRGAYVILSGGYCDAEFGDYVIAERGQSAKKGGVSGAFLAEINDILNTHRATL